jgi:hypothetical protein
MIRNMPLPVGCSMAAKIKIDIIKPAQGGQRGLALMNSRF